MSNPIPNYRINFEKNTITVLDADAALADEALRLCIKFMPYPGTHQQQKSRAAAQRARLALWREK